MNKEIMTENEKKYLKETFQIMKNMMNLTVADKKTNFNSTEMRLLGEIFQAKAAGKRLISTQLAKLIGVTRSAVSQIVNRLESQGIVERVADDVDRKIAYVEITESAMERYGEDIRICANFMGRVVKRFGEENFETMCTLFDGFYEALETEKADFVTKRKYRKSTLE